MACQLANGDIVPGYLVGGILYSSCLQFRYVLGDGGIKCHIACLDEESVNGKEFRDAAKTIYGICVDLRDTIGTILNKGRRAVILEE
jgi:hypothetical protein